LSFAALLSGQRFSAHSEMGMKDTYRKLEDELKDKAGVMLRTCV